MKPAATASMMPRLASRDGHDGMTAGARRLGQSGWSIVPIIGVAMSAWYLLPGLLLLVATLTGCATAAPRKMSVMWLPQTNYVRTCALLAGATVMPEGCVTRSETGCTIVTPAKQVSYDLFGGQMKECLR